MPALRVLPNLKDVRTARLKNYGYDLLTPLNIKCVYQIDKEAEKKLVNMEARKNILLIAKEAINNIGKYSQGTEVFGRRWKMK